MYQNKQAVALGSLALMTAVAILLILLAFWAWPKYKVYKLELDGIAALKEAEWSKQILIEEAKAREQAALMQAKAKVTLAEAEGRAMIARAKAEGQADIERAKRLPRPTRLSASHSRAMKPICVTCGSRGCRKARASASIFQLRPACLCWKREKPPGNSLLPGKPLVT